MFFNSHLVTIRCSQCGRPIGETPNAGFRTALCVVCQSGEVKAVEESETRLVEPLKVAYNVKPGKPKPAASPQDVSVEKVQRRFKFKKRIS